MLMALLTCADTIRHQQFSTAREDNIFFFEQWEDNISAARNNEGGFLSLSRHKCGPSSTMGASAKRAGADGDATLKVGV